MILLVAYIVIAIDRGEIIIIVQVLLTIINCLIIISSYLILVSSVEISDLQLMLEMARVVRHYLAEVEIYEQKDKPHCCKDKD